MYDLQQGPNGQSTHKWKAVDKPRIFLFILDQVTRIKQKINVEDKSQDRDREYTPRASKTEPIRVVRRYIERNIAKLRVSRRADSFTTRRAKSLQYLQYAQPSMAIICKEKCVRP